MLLPVIDWDICLACDPCEARAVCNTRAIVKIDIDEPPYIAYERCNRCGDCVQACCCGAIVLKNVPNAGSKL